MTPKITQLKQLDCWYNDQCKEKNRRKGRLGWGWMNIKRRVMKRARVGFVITSMNVNIYLETQKQRWQDNNLNRWIIIRLNRKLGRKYERHWRVILKGKSHDFELRYLDKIFYAELAFVSTEFRGLILTMLTTWMTIVQWRRRNKLLGYEK